MLRKGFLFNVLPHISPYIYIKERSGRVGMTVVSVLLGAAVEVVVGSKPTFAK